MPYRSLRKQRSALYFCKLKLLVLTRYYNCLYEVHIFREPLNKSHLKIVCTSCLHIFRHIAHNFEKSDEKSVGAICTNDLISASLELTRYYCWRTKKSTPKGAFLLFTSTQSPVCRFARICPLLLPCHRLIPRPKPSRRSNNLSRQSR